MQMMSYFYMENLHFQPKSIRFALIIIFILYSHRSVICTAHILWAANIDSAVFKTDELKKVRLNENFI